MVSAYNSAIARGLRAAGAEVVAQEAAKAVQEVNISVMVIWHNVLFMGGQPRRLSRYQLSGIADDMY